MMTTLKREKYTLYTAVLNSDTKERAYQGSKIEERNYSLSKKEPYNPHSN